MRRTCNEGRDLAGIGDGLQSRNNVDAVVHQIAVALLNDVAKMDANAKFDPPFGLHAGVALEHAVLHLDGAAHGVNDAAEFDDAAVAGTFNHAPMMHSHGWIDQVTPKRPAPRQSAIFVGPGESAVADHIRDKDRCYLPGSRHSGPSGAVQSSTRKA
jgi:hypothetical protein